MKIYSINYGLQTKNCSNSKVRKGLGNETVIKEPVKIDQPAFKGLNGAGIGAVVTGVGCIFGLTALSLATLSNPIGWGAAAAMYFGSAATMAAGGYVGHKIEDAVEEFKDKNKNNDKKI